MKSRSLEAASGRRELKCQTNRCMTVAVRRRRSQGTRIDFNGATLMITGGTGTFGSTVLKHFLTSDIGQIRIFSRDEKKQDDMRHDLQARFPDHAKKVKFYIGDVRDPRSVADAMPGVDYIFHAAALKQVPSCEFFPMQAVKTNIEGTDNVLHAAVDAGVKRVVCLSTDKAAYPINAMGISKAMMEHVIYANARVAAERGGTVRKSIWTLSEMTSARRWATSLTALIN